MEERFFSEDWTVIESEIRPYCEGPLAGISQNEGSDPDDHEEERDLDVLTPVDLEARYERTVLLDSWYVKLFEQGWFSSRSQYST